MPIKPEHLDELLSGYEKPEHLLGEDGLFKQLVLVAGSWAKEKPREYAARLGARSSSKNSMCDELVDNQDYDDSRKNEHPIGNLHARY